jgi:hypothetical protein
MISSQNVVNVVDTAWSQSDFREISRPHSSVRVFSLVLRIVRRVNSIMDHSVSVLPLLIVILFEMVMGRVDGKQADNALKNEKIKQQVLTDYRPYQAQHRIFYKSFRDNFRSFWRRLGIPF